MEYTTAIVYTIKVLCANAAGTSVLPNDDVCKHELILGLIILLA